MQSFQTTALKHLDVSDGGKLIRFTFDSRQGEVAFEIPASAYATLLPFLLRAKVISDEKQGGDTAACFPIQAISIELVRTGVTMALHLEEGADFAFQLDAPMARSLASEIQKHLGPSDGTSPSAAG